MKLKRIYNTVAMVKDGYTLYNSFAIMLVKIFGYRQMNYKMPQ